MSEGSAARVGQEISATMCSDSSSLTVLSQTTRLAVSSVDEGEERTHNHFRITLRVRHPAMDPRAHQ
jgi:hypothetical protein